MGCGPNLGQSRARQGTSEVTIGLEGCCSFAGGSRDLCGQGNARPTNAGLVADVAARVYTTELSVAWAAELL